MFVVFVGLVVFLVLVGYVFDVVFVDIVKVNLCECLKNYVIFYVVGIDFICDCLLYICEQLLDLCFDVFGSGLYLQVVMLYGKGNLMFVEGLMLFIVGGGLLVLCQEVFEGLLLMIQIDGSQGLVYCYGLGLVWGVDVDFVIEFLYIIYVMEDLCVLGVQLCVFCGCVWFYLGGIGLILLLLQIVILQWSLCLLCCVIIELIKVQCGEIECMSECYLCELELLIDSINVFIESECENFECQCNILVDLVYSLKMLIVVLCMQMDSGVGDGVLCEELDVQLQCMNNLVLYQLVCVVLFGYKLFFVLLLIEFNVEEIVCGLEKVYVFKGVLCEFDIDLVVCFYGELGDLQELFGNLLENVFKWVNCCVLLIVQLLLVLNVCCVGLLLVVDDDGLGIVLDDIGKVLQCGVCGDECVQGYGIGLLIVQDLIKDYRGELIVGCLVELGGVCFEVCLLLGL